MKRTWPASFCSSMSLFAMRPTCQIWQNVLLPSRWISSVILIEKCGKKGGCRWGGVEGVHYEPSSMRQSALRSRFLVRLAIRLCT